MTRRKEQVQGIVEDKSCKLNWNYEGGIDSVVGKRVGYLKIIKELDFETKSVTQ